MGKRSKKEKEVIWGERRGEGVTKYDMKAEAGEIRRRVYVRKSWV